MKTTGLNIIEAVKAAKEGKKIKRKNCDTLWRCVENGHLMSGNVIFSPPADEYLDNDWEIYPEPPKTMTWNEALELLEAGKKVRRLAWKEDCYAHLGKSTAITMYMSHGRATLDALLLLVDYKATDWIEVKGEQT